MYLLIDVYPAGECECTTQTDGTNNSHNNLNDAAEPEPTSPVQLVHPVLQPVPTLTLHAYPALAAHHPEGTLLTFGRKRPAQVLLPNDPSVSRSHGRLFFVKNNCKTDPNHDNTNNNKKNDDAFTLVLENWSKSGCFVVRPLRRLRNEPHKPPDDSEDPYSSSYAGAVRLSPVSSQILRARGLDPSAYALHPVLGVNEQCTLSELNNDNSSNHSQVMMIQCGRFHSTLVLRRRDWVLYSPKGTPSPLSLLSSSSSSSSNEEEEEEKEEAAALAQIGATRERHNKFAPTITHVVTTKTLQGSPSQLAAWCRGATFVLPSYIAALLLQVQVQPEKVQVQQQRTCITDPMPQVADHSPPTALGDFWHVPPPPSWQAWTFLTPTQAFWSSLSISSASKRRMAAAAAAESVELVRATGAHIMEYSGGGTTLSSSRDDLTQHMMRRMEEETHSPPPLSTNIIRRRRYFALNHPHWISPTVLESVQVIVLDVNMKLLASRLTRFLYPDGSSCSCSSSVSGVVVKTSTTEDTTTPPPPTAVAANNYVPEEEETKGQRRQLASTSLINNDHDDNVGGKAAEQEITGSVRPHHGDGNTLITGDSNDEEDRGDLTTSENHIHDHEGDGKKRARPMSSSSRVDDDHDHPNGWFKVSTTTTDENDNNDDNVENNSFLATTIRVKGYILKEPLYQKTLSSTRTVLHPRHCRGSGRHRSVDDNDYRGFCKNQVLHHHRSTTTTNTNNNSSSRSRSRSSSRHSSTSRPEPDVWPLYSVPAMSGVGTSSRTTTTMMLLEESQHQQSKELEARRQRADELFRDPTPIPTNTMMMKGTGRSTTSRYRR